MFQGFVRKGATDKSVRLRIIDSTDGTPETGVVFNTSGIDLWYRRELSAVVSITEATLAALTTAHADGGFLHISHGLYRLDLPDAAFATGADYVEFGGTVTGMVVITGMVVLIDSNILFDTVRGGFTALPNAAADAAGGLPISDAGGLDLDVQIGTDIDAILVDTGTTLDGRLPAALVSGRIDASVGAMAANTVTATAIAADAITDAKVASDVTIASVTGAVGSVTGAVGSVTGAVGSVTGLTAANVGAILALLDDARGEPGQGAPPVNPDLVTKVDWLYKFLRNRITQTSTTLSVFADDGTTVDHKATVSDDATTYTRGEIVSGP